MLRRALTTGCCLVAAGTALSACAPSPAPTATGSAHPTASAPATLAASPSPTPVPVPPGPFAVVVTNSGRTGATYEVMLINDDAQIVAQTTAQLPTLQPNQTLSLPLVSVSNTTAYFLDGNTAIDSLSPTGATAPATQVADGASEEIAFAVSPDNQLIAIAEISEQSETDNDTGEGYVQGLANGGNPVSLWNNDGVYALRWPAGWDGTSLIDAISGASQACEGYGSCGGDSYHVVDPTTGDLIDTVCQTPASQPSYGTPNATITSYAIQGLPTPAGAACYETADSYDQYGRYAGETDSVEAVGWSGNATTFTQATPGPDQNGGVDLYTCTLSPDGSRMACRSSSNGALALVSSNGNIINTGHTYDGIMGWIDATHLLVDVDSGDLGVLDPDTGALTTLAVPQASDVEMVATLPGSL
ncbi:MAG: hypothetical protein ACLQGJ_05980 [Candidatus Dormibacteria bacterium]